MTPRDAINSVRDYERFLRQRGFSRREAVTLARSYRDLEKAAAGLDWASQASLKVTRPAHTSTRN